MLKRTLVSLVAVGLLYLPASAAAILSDGEFSAPIGQASWTAGTDAFSDYYTNTIGGSPANLEPADGNPDAHLRLRQYGCNVTVGVPAPAGEQDWNVAFDWKRAQSWGNPNFEIWVLNDGDAVQINSFLYGADAVTTGGTKLYDTVLSGNTAGEWLAQSFDVTVPAGYDAVVLTWFMDGSDDNGRIDNLVITPEPATLAVLAVGGVALLRRRR
jgi:hypothetical protein